MRMLLSVGALGGLVLALAVLAAGERVWMLDLLTFFWPVFTLAAAALLLATLPFGGAFARIAALAAVGICAVPFIMLPPAPYDAEGEKIRILTANLYIGNPDPRPFVALLTRSQPDIVVTQETCARFAEAIRGSGLYPFETEGALSDSDDKKVFSRYPIREYRQLDDLPGRKVARHAMRLVVETPAGPVVVYAIHPDTPRSVEQWLERNAYFDRLAVAVLGESGRIPVILAGDWNMPAYSAFFREFLATTGYRFARPGLLLPVTRFATRLSRLGYFGSTIDHVAVSPQVRVTGWRRGSDIGSNHLPVIVDLALPSASALASREAK